METRRLGVALMLVLACVADWACDIPTTSYSIAFGYEPDAFELPSRAHATVGGALTLTERHLVEQTSRIEIDRAFSELAVSLSADDHAFWRVRVLKTLPPLSSRPRLRAAESLTLGFLGGAGNIGFDVVAAKAIDYAPTGADREVMIRAIGRAVGRVAVHEFIHQILGADFADNYTDHGSYEYGRIDRSAAFYGDLHWGPARPLLERRVGKRASPHPQLQ
jgi:hypothetical protein